MLSFEISKFTTIYFFHHILKWIKWNRCEESKCIWIIYDTIYSLKSLHCGWSSRRKHEDRTNIRTIYSTMCCIDCITTWCSEYIDHFILCESREKMRKELECYILKCKCRSVPKMERVQITCNMFYWSNYWWWVPLISICFSYNSSHFVFWYSKVELS